MEREIKFCGKRIDCNEWVYGQLIHYKSGAIRIVENRHERVYNVFPKSVGQFTGLLDKNGKEAYSSYIYKDGDGHTWLLCQDNLSVWAELLPDRISWTRDFTPEIFNTDCEIIGNIYENPELLTTK